VSPPMLNAKSSENFLSPDQNLANFGGFGGLGVRGLKKLRFLPQKARPCVNPRRLSHFASKSVEGVTSRSVGEKTRSSAIAGRPCDAKACQGLLK